MLRLIFFLLIVCSSQILNAQAPKWDSTFRPGGFQLKVDQFKSYDDKNAFVFLGNSITAGTDWVELLGIKNAVNRGISSDITFGILDRLDEVISGTPKKVFILIGINDISRNIPDHVILDNYKKIIKRIQSGSPRTKIYFHTILPVNNEFVPVKNQFNKDEHIIYLNAELKKLVKTHGIFVIDLYSHFLNKENKLEKKYTYDGLHLNAAGYKLWADVLKSSGYLKK